MFILPAFLLICCGQNVSRINAGNDDVYSSVPEQYRNSLRETVERMIALRKTSRWELLFDLIDNQRGISKEQYILESKKLYKLIEFKPTNVAYYPPGDIWTIHGCAVFKPMPRKGDKAVYSVINARQSNDGWKLSDILIEVPKNPAETQPCSEGKD
jgi:hypothetical protein